MPSEFVGHLLRPLALSRPPSPPPSRGITDPDAKNALQDLLLVLNGPLSPSLVDRTVPTLQQLASVADSECVALKQAIVNKLVVALYAEAIETCLSQATDAETEAEWWADIERSRRNVAWYLLQTTPFRLLNLGAVILQALRTQNLPLTLSNLTPTSLRRLFPSTDPRRPSPLSKALFPHLHHQPFSLTSSTTLFSSSPSANGHVSTRLWAILYPILSWTDMPVELARQECRFKRRALEKIRDRKAEALGLLARMRGDLATAVKGPSDLQPFLYVLACIVKGEPYDTFTHESAPTESNLAFSNTLSELHNLSMTIFNAQKATEQYVIDSQQLRRPSWLTLTWPQLLLLPPLCLYGLRSAYTSQATLIEVAHDATETAKGFFRGWLIDPLKDVLKTVRAGGEEGVIVRKEGVAADYESLERMALSLARDELHYGPEQLQALSQQIKRGDLTPVLQLYEEDIRKPLKSVITGTLLRSVFIQVQKAKVDIDQALEGIDKLLKSQELTFAFVGVAPALGIIYLLGGSLLTLVRGGTGRGKYGGKRKVNGTWTAMRRIERLLVLQPRGHHRNHEADSSISPLTSGLLLLSVARLRTYAETCLPARSTLREGFLDDVVDLEDPDLGRTEKMRVVERMWRCWGEVLGWGRIAEEGARR